jgi:hypothetical protein
LHSSVFVVLFVVRGRQGLETFSLA